MTSMRAGAMERKRRPALVISPNVRNRWATDVLVIPCSTKIRPMSTHIVLQRGEGGIPQSSVALCEQVTNVSKLLLDARPLGGVLSDDRMRQIEKALLFALGILPEEEGGPAAA